MIEILNLHSYINKWSSVDHTEMWFGQIISYLSEKILKDLFCRWGVHLGQGILVLTTHSTGHGHENAQWSVLQLSYDSTQLSEVLIRPLIHRFSIANLSAPSHPRWHLLKTRDFIIKREWQLQYHEISYTARAVKNVSSGMNDAIILQDCFQSTKWH